MVIAEIIKVFVKGPMRGQTVTEYKHFDDIRMAQDWFEQNKGKMHGDYVVDDLKSIREPD